MWLPHSVAVDSAGNVYFSTSDCVAKVDPSGALTRLAGGPRHKGETYLRLPISIALDTAGNLFIADRDDGRIRKILPNGMTITVAGNGGQLTGEDGVLATKSQVRMPNGVAVDGAGNIYIAEDDRIRKVNPRGIITTYAGGPSPGYSGDGGPARKTELGNLQGIAVDASGNLYVADWRDNRILKVSSRRVITTVAGNGTFGYSGDGGPATAAELAHPSAVSVDNSGNLYIADVSNHRIRKVSSSGVISTVAGSGPVNPAEGSHGNGGFSGDGGPAIEAKLNTPVGVAVDAVGNLYIADMGNFRIRKVSPTGVITTVAGNEFPSYAGSDQESGPTPELVSPNSGYSGDGGPAINSQLNRPSRLSIDATDNVYFTDSGNERVRKISPVGVISTVAGDGERGDRGDGGDATSAQLTEPSGVAVDRFGVIYFGDGFSIRKVSPTGIISTLKTRMISVTDVAVDERRNVYTTDSIGGCVLKISSNGVVTVVAAKCDNFRGDFGDSGDGGAATRAQLGLPSGVAVDRVGNLYVADSYNARVRKVSPNGIITAFAGNGSAGYSGDGGPAIAAQLSEPMGVAVDNRGNVYITDPENARVRKVSPNGIITVFAGNGSAGYSGDGGPAIAAQLSEPIGVAVDDRGNVYIADRNNHRIRKVDSTGTISTIAGGGTSGHSCNGGPARDGNPNDPSASACQRSGTEIESNTAAGSSSGHTSW
jgi:sugar lactone lactonase YvrE